ncbi:MAG: hypothetical protein QW372_05325 [Nitrososphaerales archaeon]
MVIGRFQVMAILQAARAFILGMPEESAKSWGLNRAIFYAAAKRGFKGTSPMTAEYQRAKIGEEIDVYRLGDEIAFKEVREGKLYFTIGGKILTEKDFYKQIESRFGESFHEAWKEALKIVSMYDHAILLSQRRFYEEVYKPMRDELAKRWTELSLKKLKIKI